MSHDDVHGQPHAHKPFAPSAQPGPGFGPGTGHGELQPFAGQRQPAPTAEFGPGLTMFPQPYKDTTAAWLLWFFLGHWGGHDFYLRRPGAAVGKIVLTGIGAATAWLIVGIPFLVAVFIWWIVDAATMSGRLQQVNAQVFTNNRAFGPAR